MDRCSSQGKSVCIQPTLWPANEWPPPSRDCRWSAGAKRCTFWRIKGAHLKEIRLVAQSACRRFWRHEQVVTANRPPVPRSIRNRRIIPLRCSFYLLIVEGLGLLHIDRGLLRQIWPQPRKAEGSSPFHKPTSSCHQRSRRLSSQATVHLAPVAGISNRSKSISLVVKERVLISIPSPITS
jgi:hypothetical protein